MERLMCGICGKVSFDKDHSIDIDIIKRMMGVMNHRGPDDAGIYLSEHVALGHRRLSIIDVKTGKQPISNEDGTVWIVYNGEIYNYRDLMSDLKSRGHVFRTKSDTEVIVHLYEEKGEGCVEDLRGMYSFGIWNERERTLFLARDRVGIKPLYYYLGDDCLLFASEIKSILEDPTVKREVSPRSLWRFLRFHYTLGVETPFRDVFKLNPGHYLIFKNGNTQVKQYWDLNFVRPQAEFSFSEAVRQLVDLLRETTRGHMISDVPVGFLLSGGVDSSSLLSFAVEEAERLISTFTIGFEGAHFEDERRYARLVAKRLGTDHYEMTISAKDFAEFLPKYVWHMEEPVCEPPAIALYYVSKMAREYVKVLLSGEGGDEGFAGYPEYRNVVWFERLKGILGPVRNKASDMIQVLTRRNRFGRFNKYAQMMKLPLRNYYFSRTSNPFTYFNSLFPGLSQEKPGFSVDGWAILEPVRELFDHVQSLDSLSQMLYVDTKTWLPDDLLIKADKITMANSLELRVPFLDHKVLEFAAGLPPHYKLRGFSTKYILRKAFTRRVPQEVLRRKKAGFPIPYDRWLRNELKDFVWDILSDKRTSERGFFDRKTIVAMVEQDGKNGDYSTEIFCLLALELWHRIFLDEKGGRQNTSLWLQDLKQVNRDATNKLSRSKIE
jgi:asparagine synthase (glutamine-hydrolysing)